ncbi:MAG: cell division protein FtsQ/DivIB [Rhizobiaceae bacterium]
MQQVGKRQGVKPGLETQVSASPQSGHGGGIVLPRLLRWPLRHSLRLVNHGFSVSGKKVAAFCVAIVLGGGVAGLVQSGQADEMIAEASAWAGFRIADVEISGLSEISRIDILTNIDLGADRSLFSFDVRRARDDLRGLAWASDVAVAKAYPDKVVVKVVERQPFAVWQNGQSLYLVERDGREIVPFDDRFAGLPLLVGTGANKAGANLVAAVQRHPELAGKVKAYVRVADRRWDIVLDGDLRVMLPEFEPERQLGELARLEREEQVLSRALDSIDMRFTDRLVMRLTPQAAEMRKEAVETRLEQMKKRKKEQEI